MPGTTQGSRAVAEQDYRVYFTEDLVLDFERSRQSESKSSVSAAFAVGNPHPTGLSPDCAPACRTVPTLIRAVSKCERIPCVNCTGTAAFSHQHLLPVSL